MTNTNDLAEAPEQVLEIAQAIIQGPEFEATFRGLGEAFAEQLALAAQRGYQAALALRSPWDEPYAHEFGKSNGDGTYCVVIEKGPRSYADKFAVPDWPIKPLYARAQSMEARDALLAEVISLIEDDMYGPGEAEDVPEREAFNKALRRQINRITSRLIVAPKLSPGKE